MAKRRKKKGKKLYPKKQSDYRKQANKKARIKYITTKAAPPFSAALVGKPQILPRPTAEPDAAKINAKREEN